MRISLGQFWLARKAAYFRLLLINTFIKLSDVSGLSLIVKEFIFLKDYRAFKSWGINFFVLIILLVYKITIFLIRLSQILFSFNFLFILIIHLYSCSLIDRSFKLSTFIDLYFYFLKFRNSIIKFQIFVFEMLLLWEDKFIS